MALLAVALAVAVVAAVRGMWSPCGLSMLSSLNPVSEARARQPVLAHRALVRRRCGGRRCAARRWLRGGRVRRTRGWTRRRR